MMFTLLVFLGFPIPFAKPAKSEHVAENVRAASRGAPQCSWGRNRACGQHRGIVRVLRVARRPPSEVRSTVLHWLARHPPEWDPHPASPESSLHPPPRSRSVRCHHRPPHDGMTRDLVHVSDRPDDHFAGLASGAARIAVLVDDLPGNDAGREIPRRGGEHPRRRVPWRRLAGTRHNAATRTTPCDDVPAPALPADWSP